MAIQDLNEKFSIVDPNTGKPTTYLLRLLRDRGSEVSGFDARISTNETNITALTTRVDSIDGTVFTAGTGLAGGGTLGTTDPITFSFNGSLDNLSDVDVTTSTPTNGQALVYDSVGAEWVPGSLVGSLDDLSDVDVTTTTPTNGQALVYNSAGAEWRPGTISGGGGGSSATLYSPSGASSVDIVLGSGECYEIDYFLVPSNDAVVLQGQVTNDAFSTVETGSVYAYVDYRQGTSGTTTSSSDADTKLMFQNPVGNATDEYCAGSIKVFNPSDSGNITAFWGQGTRKNGSNQQNMDNSAGTYEVAEAINGLRLSFSAGTMTGWVVVREIVGA